MRDFNDLRFFAAVVTHRGFSAAARELGVPKSRISRRVAVLEEQLGVRLLERSTRQLNVTEVGQDVYRHARAAMVEAEAVDEVAARMRSEPQGLIRLSCPLGLQRTVSHALPAFLSEYPRLRIQLLITNRPVDLIEEAVDIAIRIRERLDVDADLVVKRIGTSRRILVASDSLLQQYRRPKTLDDLSRLPTLHSTERPGPASWTLSGPDGRTSKIDIQPRLSAGDFAVLLNAAVHGLGVALLPQVDCRDSIASEKLERVLPEWSVADGILHLVFTSRRGMLPGVRAVVDFVAETLKSQDTA